MTRSEWLAVGQNTVTELIKLAEQSEATVAATLRVQRDALIADIEAGRVPSPEKAKIAVESLVNAAGNQALITAKRGEGVMVSLVENAITVAKAALVAALA